MIDIRREHLEVVKEILYAHVPDCEVWAFGSRIQGNAKAYSDLDIVVVGERKIESKRFYSLKEAFEDSELPMRVDVLDWQAISESFRNVIKKKYEILQHAACH